ncbi:P44/Msp2 family outer membrane protein [Candidatus Neoehrlichia procyonis]|uniref:Surface antigen family protein n=1 Tax=Candidatus Neoehrlichia procyonis str. RAC413 TaxID=1359163 RepID=A0A0F3NR72_9RICK|nr:P44/Msp2 family outer membrane protein [Candidatus Neoehrlichia lotoris]KJV69409.1 surface antigen family protein [Candidatus Neoehrlichia lotoris str. RAC413]
MSYKKLRLVIFIIFCMIGEGFSVESFSQQGVNGSFYISGQYKPGISVFSNFYANETLPTSNTKGKYVYGLDVNYRYMVPGMTNSDFTRVLQDINYDNNLLGFAFSVGYYYYNNLRIEFECAFENFNPSQGNYKFENHQYFAVPYCTEARESSCVPLQTNKFVVLKNEGIFLGSGIVSICYDVMYNEGLYPYICGGAGVESVSFLKIKEPKFAYQAKFGMNYYVNSNVMIFCGGYYHGIAGNEYRRIPVYAYPDNSRTITDISAQLDTAYFGLEIGLRLLL